MRHIFFKASFLCLFTASCTTTDIDDQTQSETPIEPTQGYSVSVETHNHGVYSVDPVTIMCENIKQGLDNIEGYHPIFVVEAYPSYRGHALRFGYDYGITPKQNLVNRLNSGRVYGYLFYNQSPRDSYAYRLCMPPEQKALVDAYLDTMTACRAFDFGIYHEEWRGGIAIEGHNGRACGVLGRELIDANIQGYRPTLLGRLSETGTMITGGLLKTGDSGAMLSALNRCIDADKDFNMGYSADSNQLSFTCVNL